MNTNMRRYETRTRIWIPLALLFVCTSAVLIAGASLALEEQQVLQARYHRLHLDELLKYRELITRMAKETPDEETTAAEILRYLPADAPRRELGRGALIDASGRTRHYWGATLETPGLFPLISVPLLPPFERWQLQYSMPKEFWTRRLYGSALLTVVPSTLLALLLLLALSRHLLFVHRRELDEAAKRVNFVNQVSHELKTPLTNIRLYAELLAARLPETEAEAEEDRAALKVILSETERLSRLIANVLTFGGRSRGEEQPLSTSTAVPAELIAEVIRDFEPRFSKAGIKVETFFRDNTKVCFNGDLLKQILFNLFSNIEKYGVSGRYAAVTLSRRAKKMIIDVSDRGPGVSAEARDKIFDPFFRDAKLEEGTSGSGLGLTICRQLARAHGGDVELLDSPRGAVFRVRLEVDDVAEGVEVPRESACL